MGETTACVKADKALTLFMMNTLVENARKYTQEGGKVSLSAEETPDYVEIAVEDNGPGLSEKDRMRILGEKVYDSGAIGMDTATDAAELQRQKGHGFGLMNCKGIIENTGRRTACLRFAGSTYKVRQEKAVVSLSVCPKERGGWSDFCG